MKNNDMRPWIQYRDKNKQRIEESIAAERIKEAEDEISNAFYYCKYIKSRLSEDSKKMLYLPFVQIQDILRGCLASQEHLILLGSAFNLRIAFDVCLNLIYINKSDDQKEMCRRFVGYAKYESATIPEEMISYMELDQHEDSKDYNIQKQKEKVIKDFPCWVNKDGSLKKNIHWSGNNNIRSTLDFVRELYDKKDVKFFGPYNLKEAYYKVHKTSSKYIHASPLTQSMFNPPTFKNQLLTVNNIFTSIYCIRGIALYCCIVKCFDCNEKDFSDIIKNLDKSLRRFP